MIEAEPASDAASPAWAHESDCEQAVAHDRLRVVIADSDPLARRVLRDAFQSGPSFVVAAEAADGVEAVELAVHYRPELVLMEAVLPRLDGIEATRRIVARAPEVKVVMFTVARHEGVEIAALRAGADGFLAKDVPVEAVVRALRGVVHGEAAVSRSLTLELVDRFRRMPQAGAGVRPVRSPLTEREWQVLDLMSAGAAKRQIAAELGLSQDTVYSHIKNIMRKLGVHTRAAAVEAADRLCRLEGALLP